MIIEVARFLVVVGHRTGFQYTPKEYTYVHVPLTTQFATVPILEAMIGYSHRLQTM
jgi:hypothetical protein